jgi:SPP1 family predicted phage head-tail adaptor
MSTPRIGALRHRLRLEAPSRSAAAGGGADITWQFVADVWAEVTQREGRELVVADGLAARQTYEVRTRYRADVAADMRFVSAGRALDIRSVRDPDGRRRWLLCVCEETAP